MEYLQGIETKQQEILDIIDSRYDKPVLTEQSLSEQEKSLIDVFRQTTEEGRLLMIQSVLNIRDAVEKKTTSETAADVG